MDRAQMIRELAERWALSASALDFLALDQWNGDITTILAGEHNRKVRQLEDLGPLELEEEYRRVFS